MIMMPRTRDSRAGVHRGPPAARPAGSDWPQAARDSRESESTVTVTAAAAAARVAAAGRTSAPPSLAGRSGSGHESESGC